MLREVKNWSYKSNCCNESKPIVDFYTEPSNPQVSLPN